MQVSNFLFVAASLSRPPLGKSDDVAPCDKTELSANAEQDKLEAKRKRHAKHHAKHSKKNKCNSHVLDVDVMNCTTIPMLMILQQKQEQQKKDQAPPPQEPGLGEHHKEMQHHHGKDAAKKVGNAIMFGAGATAGSDAVQGIVKNL
ncbi:unnamed protein product [Clonostachys rosea]|uniref:Uncharacterized protein n=1 Tax=Bionectria ochroleuca TaxID=29856 RepID=A0ABY6U8D0_BIOOC|nr:unnamed protein product [Clonostachys rosea]